MVRILVVGSLVVIFCRLESFCILSECDFSSDKYKSVKSTQTRITYFHYTCCWTRIRTLANCNVNSRNLLKTRSRNESDRWCPLNLLELNEYMHASKPMSQIEMCQSSDSSEICTTLRCTASMLSPLKLSKLFHGSFVNKLSLLLFQLLTFLLSSVELLGLAELLESIFE